MNGSEVRITDETFERDPNFNLRRYAKQSFGTYQERPVRVTLRFSTKAARGTAAFQLEFCRPKPLNVSHNPQASRDAKPEPQGTSTPRAKPSHQQANSKSQQRILLRGLALAFDPRSMGKCLKMSDRHGN